MGTAGWSRMQFEGGGDETFTMEKVEMDAVRYRE
jgi:hypothetical protein